MRHLTTALVATTLLALTNPTLAQSLSGSRASMEKQHEHAVRHSYTFVRSSRGVTDVVGNGELVRVSPGRYIVLHNVSYPYVRPAVKTLLERLSSQYHNACGERLTVTSMTRPIERQPANASDLSVHPTGMAFDLRIPQKSTCRSWLERTLLALEDNHVLDVTRERNPPHYHVAVFPEPYQNYVLAMSGQNREYIVSRGDTLSRIAASTNSTVAQIRSANSLRGDMINVGQRLTIPGTATPGTAATAAISSVAADVSNSVVEQRIVATREVTHQVRQGETLWRIANRYRTSVDALRSANGMADDLLRVGQVLRVITDDT